MVMSASETGMLVRQPVETVAYPVESLNFVQNCSRRHCLSDVPESLEKEKFTRADLVQEACKRVREFIPIFQTLINVTNRIKRRGQAFIL
jgi:hypothetical protein